MSIRKRSLLSEKIIQQKIWVKGKKKTRQKLNKHYPKIPLYTIHDTCILGKKKD